MRTLLLIAALVSLGSASVQSSLAADPSPPPGQGASQLDFSPPPVPEFMLRKPAKPLTLEEMQKQADEAARRARADRQAPPPQPAETKPEAAKEK